MNRARICLLLLLPLLGIQSAQAERYLSVDQAIKLCFPEADRFEARTNRFTAGQRSAVEKRIQRKIPNLGNRWWIAWKGELVAGVVIIDHVLGKHEIIDYAVALEPGGEIRQLEILEYRESYGGEVRTAHWRDQFRKKSARSALRLSDDIFNISGATMSCRHVTEGVQRVLATYEAVLRPLLPVSEKQQL